MYNRFERAPGGKGNKDMFIERDPKIYPAGVPSKQPEISVKDCFKQCTLQDTVDALIHDSIKPDPPPRRLPPLRHEPKLDMRNAGIYSEGAELINPPQKTKFQTLVDDFKNTLYNSYWKKPLGKIPEQVTLPPGLNIYETTLGKPTPFDGRLYDVIMPTHPVPDRTPLSKSPGIHLDRKYCKPPYKDNVTFGCKSNVDHTGRTMKCTLTDDRIYLGTASKTPISSKQADFREVTQSLIGESLTPNDNIKCVPSEFSFGILKPPDNLPECLTTYKLNPEREKLLLRLKHLNTLRRYLFRRLEPDFFRKFYLSLKYIDQDKSGWLPKETVYNCCASKYIRFNTTLIEPLLSLWNAFDGDRIEYKIFVNVINFRDPCPDLPKIPSLLFEYKNYETTYADQTKSVHETDTSFMAGLPSGRYFDIDYPITPERCSKADRTYLPEESNMKSCINPSTFTLLGVSHRDMFAKRDPDIVRRVFQAAGETFNNEQFNTIWEEAKKYHSQGWVCFETFRRALRKTHFN